MTPASILATRLAELAVRPASVHPGELQELADLAAGLDAYPGHATSDESTALAELASATQRHDWAQAPGGLEQEMLSGHVEGQFLAMLVHTLRARRVLEIGMFTGYSALAMAEALLEGGTVVACELDAEVAAFARAQFARSPAGDRIDIRVAPAVDTLRELAAAGDSFDLIFVDADKGGYESYVGAVLDGGLLAPHGLLCIDNTMLQGEPWTGALTQPGAAITRFNAALSADPRIVQVLVPLRDGITLARLVATT